MFLRATPRKKDGKLHHYWRVVENRRVAQRYVLYPGEINDAQRAAWCKSISVLEGGQPQARQMAIFPEHRSAPELSCAVVHVKLDGMRLVRPRQWGTHCSPVTLKAKLKSLAGGLTPRAVLEQFAAMQRRDVHLPTTDGRERVLTLRTEPEADLRLLIAQMKLELPAQDRKSTRLNSSH